MIRLHNLAVIRTLRNCLKMCASSTSLYANGNGCHPKSGSTNSWFYFEHRLQLMQQRLFNTGTCQLARGLRQRSLKLATRELSQETLVSEHSSAELTPTEEQIDLPPIPQAAKDEEIYQGIMKMKPKEVFYLLQHYHEDMNKTHFALSMKRLHKIYKNLPEESKDNYRSLLHSQEGFKLLCALLALKGEYYEPPIVADMLLFMHDLGLDSLDPTMQVYLHLLSYNLHRLALDVLIKVTRCAVAMTPTSQVKLLRNGVKILAEEGQLISGIKVLSAAELVNMLDLMGSYLSDDDLKQLLREISTVEDEISPRLSVVLVRGLRHLDSPHYLEVEAINKINAKMEKLNPSNVIEILKACYDINLYNFELLNNIETRTLESMTLEQFKVIKQLYKFSYLAKKLLPMLLDNGELLSDSLSTWDLLALVEILSDASHKVDVEEDLVKTLLDKLKVLDFTELSSEDKLKLLVNLHILGQGHCDLANDLHGSLNSTEAIQSFSPVFSERHHLNNPVWRLHLMNHVRDGQSNTRMKEHTQHVLDELPAPRNTVAMGNMLAVALETENCVMTRPKSKDGFVVDHVIILDDQGKPINLGGKDADFLEDWTLGENHKIISVMELPGTCFHRNTRQLRGFHAWYMRQLQSRGYLVVLINSDLFESVEDENKYEYLRRKILSAEKFQDLILIS